MEINIFNTKEDLNQLFTERIVEIMSRKEIVTIALSGGSTPKSLFDYWARRTENKLNWRKINFFWGDERCVAPTDDESNYKMTKNHLFDFVPVPKEHIFRIRGENEPMLEAKKYGEILNKELEKVNGTPSFDILMLGMGEDGHTASIFPHEIKLWQSNEECVVATHPESGQKRISLSGKVINSAKHIFFLVTGENKAEKVKEIIERPEKARKTYPAALVQPDSKNLYWFLDNGASKLLAK